MKRSIPPLLLLIGCEVRTMDKLHIDPGLSPSEMEATVEAADELCLEAGECLDVVVGESPEQWVRKSNKCPGTSRAMTKLRWHRKPRILLCASEDVRTIMLHELGHAVSGRDDHLEDGNIMDRKATAEHLTDADLMYLSRD